MFLLATLLPSAEAQVRVCPGPFTPAEWSEAMDAVDLELSVLNGTRAAHLLEDVIDELRCLDAIVTPEALGRLARQVALVTFYDQDPEELVPWALLARSTLGAAPWPESTPTPAYFHELLASAPEPPPEGPDDQGLAPPRGGGVLVDGVLALQPVATARSRHLVQVVDRRGRVIETWWQRGGRFPGAWLGPPDASLGVPRWYEAPAAPLEPPVPVPAPSFARAPEPTEPTEPTEPVASTEPTEPTEPVASTEPAGTSEPSERTPTERSAPALSFAADRRNDACPWRVDPRHVEIRGPKIQVNRRVFWIRSEQDEVAFVATLRDCGEHRAARWFLRWRAVRGRPFAGAARHRDQMVAALLQRSGSAREPGRAAHGG